ncbi:MoaD/ThiS family protein [Nesterenkonia sp. CF4.4]|uniref:MoaD/ThiS family protein n=1 Tax=Nesterenkonia sp. CF4.4 TaxID=3373079 RepID=UPI003EE43124
MTERSAAPATPAAPDASAAPTTPAAPGTSPRPDISAALISVRFFAAAAEAAGAEELRLPVPADGVAVVDLLADLPRLVQDHRSAADSTAGSSAGSPQADGASAPSLDRVCARSSFLVNGVRARAESARLHPGDQLDVLPPFAGG